MIKFTEVLFKNQDSFIPKYGYNKSQKNGRAMEKNSPTFASILKKEELKEELRKTRKQKFSANNINVLLTCRKEIHHFILCLQKHGTDNFSQCTQEVDSLKNCFRTKFGDPEFATRLFDSQVDFILKNLN